MQRMVQPKRAPQKNLQVRMSEGMIQEAWIAAGHARQSVSEWTRAAVAEKLARFRATTGAKGAK